MIVNLTLKPTTYKAVRLSRNSYNDLAEMFGSALVTRERDFALESDLVVNINGQENTYVPCSEDLIIIAEYLDDEVVGVFAADNTADLSRMFDWEGEL